MNIVREHRVTMDAKGRIVLPRSMREAASLTAGSGLVASVEADGTIRIEKLSSRITRMQDRLSHYADPTSAASDELIAERRQAADGE